MVEVNAVQLAWQILEVGGAVISGLVAYIAALKSFVWMKNKFAPKRYALVSWMCAVISFSLCVTCGILLGGSTEYLVVVPSIAIVLAAVGLFAVWADEAINS